MRIRVTSRAARRKPVADQGIASSAKENLDITSASASKVGKQPSEITQSPITANSPSSPTSPAARSSLQQQLRRKSPVPLSEYITLQRLADELEIDLERLAPLIRHNYLRILHAEDTMAATVVARPTKDAMDWLRTMFMPLDLRPFIPLPEVTASLGATEDELHYVCASQGIPLYSDPAFGELLTVTGFWLLYKGLFAMRSRLRSDRQTLLLILAQIKHVEPPCRPEPLPYSDRLDKEISRIAALPEPDRTIRATEFWKIYSEANTLVECLEKLDQPLTKKEERILRRVATMEQRLGGEKKE